jgi:hypothetical protein
MFSKHVAKITASSAAASLTSIAFGIAMAHAPTFVRAETQVRGTPQAVVVEAENATVKEILVALTDTFKVQFRSAANLDKRLTGTYQGTLQQAVSRILKGYDFVVKSSHSGLEITLLGAGKPVAVVDARSATTLAEMSPAIAPTPTATADSGAGLVPTAIAGGPTPPIRIAEGPAPVPTPQTTGAATGPMPQLVQSGAAPTPLPAPATASSAPSATMPSSPTGSPSSSPPVPSTAPAPSPAR